MKKAKIITGFSAAFVTLLALTSCAGLIRGKDGVVLTINGVDYTAERLFGEQRSAAASEAKFNAVYKVAVRQYFNTDEGKNFLPDIQQNAKNKVSGQKDLAQSNASKNGTSYAEEWQKILDSNGVEDEDELYDKFEYDLEKEKFDDQFYEKHLETLKKGGDLTTGVTVDGYLNKKQPYHVKHILVKVSAAENDPTTGEITADEADLLKKVIVALANGNNFGTVAGWYSNDDGSKAKYGDLGIMDRDTSFVNEFKLGTYLYESYFGSSTIATAKDKLFEKGSKAESYAKELSELNDPSGTTDQSGTKFSGIGQIPYEAALALGKDDYTIGDDSTVYKGYANIDDTTQKFSQFLGTEKVAAKYYPRNVIFNKYFNKNNLMVITPRRLTLNTKLGDKETETITDNIINTLVNVKDVDGGKIRIADDQYRGSVNATFEGLPGFKNEIKKNNDVLTKKLVDDAGNTIVDSSNADNKVLRNHEGRIIYVFRSGSGSGDSGYQGIHFVCVERSPFMEDETEEGRTGEPVNLDKYYTYCYPGQTTTSDVKYPTYADGKDMPTYVNDNPFVEVTELKSRADEVKSKIKGYDTNLNAKIYQYLLNVGDLEFKEGDKLAQGIKADIDTWIARKIEANQIDEKDAWDKTWRDYCWKLEENNKRRAVQKESDNHYYGGTITEACAVAFAYYDIEDSVAEGYLKNMFSAGGIFHD